jgi:DNA-binding IclR family transcriptional regulator
VVHLVVLDGHEALFLERLMSQRAVHTRSRVARRLPLHATGPGKVLLAHSAPQFVDSVLAAGLPRMARGTITDPAVLRRKLAEIRACDYCLSFEEMTDGAASVAAPVRGADGEVVAAISAVVPVTTDLRPLVPAVRLAAAGISRGLRSVPLA